MLVLKVILPALVLLGSVAQYTADYVWHDKRTNRHRKARAIILIVQLLAGVGTIALVVNEHNASEKNAETIKGNATTIENIREEAKQNAEASASRDAQNQAELTALRQQVRELDGRLEPFVKIAAKKYPNLPEPSALDRLAKDLIDLRARTSRLERKVHSFAVSVELVLEGDWAEGMSQGLERALNMPNDPYVKFISSDAAPGKDIRCYPTAISRKRDAHGRVIVNFEASVRPGSWPLGQTLYELKGYSKAQIGVAMVERRNVKSSNALVKEARLKVFINGVPEVSREDLLDAVVNVPEKGIRVLNLEATDFLAPVSKKS